MRGAAEQEQSGYRRGFVLGLTLAEVGILIIFVLLLLIGLDSQPLDVPTESLVSVDTQHYEELLETSAELRAAKNLAGFSDIDDFLELVRAVAESSARSASPDLAAVLSSELGEIRTLRQKLADTLGDTEAGQLEALARDALAMEKRIGDLEAQKRGLADQLLSAGNGLVYPSCWTDLDDRPQYVYRVELASEGLRLLELAHANRVDERQRLPFPTTDPFIHLDPELFGEALKPLFEWSERNQCRFYVIAHDGTLEGEKARYKQLLRSLESRFYKFQSDEVAAKYWPIRGG